MLALALLAWAVVGAFRAPAAASVSVSTRTLAADVPRLIRSAVAPHVEAVLSAAPGAPYRDALAAIARAGGHVDWRAEHRLPDIALEVVPRVDPAGGVRAFVAADRGARVSLSDRASPLFDTIAVAEAPEAVTLAAFVPPLWGIAEDEAAIATPIDSLVLRRVAVLGAAGWEGKFLLAALEERGWRVSAAFAVAPAVAVTQGAALTLDTARTLAVIVLDSATAQSHAREIADFVRQGGGAVLAGNAAAAPALASIAAGRVGERVRPAALSFADTAPRRALGFREITRLATDALDIESREGRVAVAARRVGVGRVIQVGYDETWRWRFEGGARAAESERAWWSGVVSAAAYRAASPIASAANTQAAPLAQLIAALGPPVTTAASASVVPHGLPWWLLAVILAAIVAEIASRRLRGAP